MRIPIIDIRDLAAGSKGRAEVARRLAGACGEHGFFYVTGHGVSEELSDRLEQLSRAFFARDIESKMAIRMALGGRAWRGYFPVGGELTSGRPDLKEGLYFGEELPGDHPLVLEGTPMHGPNLFPPDLERFRETVLEYCAEMTVLGRRLMQGIAISLGLEDSYFDEGYMSRPLILFRIFNYPPTPPAERNDPPWGVGEHTDYGILTILRQDDSGGLQIKSRGKWIDAPPVPNSLVCNIGDMLEIITGGLYRSTPHRVRHCGDRDRLSFAFFFDPNFDAVIEPLDSRARPSREPGAEDRWDGASLGDFSGTYGDYLLKKVSRVFPDLRVD